MTEEVTAAESLALLSGRRARWAMFLLSELAAIAAVLMMLQTWDQAKTPLYVGSFLLASIGPALNLLVPQGMREEYARLMSELVAQRNESIAQARAYREIINSDQQGGKG